MMVITLFTALFLTHSRGGFFSTLLAVIIFFGLSFLTGKMKTGKTALFLLLGLVGVVILFGFWNSGDELVDRFGRVNADKQGREAVYQILHKAILENAWLGTGYGSFEYSFRLYRDEQVDSFYDLAHNTYLENMFELGVVPALALFAAIANLAVQCLKGVWIRQRDWSFAALGFAMTVLVGTHALVDFSLQIPAVAYTYALLIGAACAQAQPRQYRLASGT
jgi:O-antigen ligase